MYTLLFPGQGSQSPGMGQFLFDNFKIAKETFQEASEAIQFNLEKLCFTGSEADLALTENTQPALLCVSTATQRVLLSEFNFKVSAAAGHSIGEYAALVAAKSLPFAAAMKSVRIRGQAMQSAVPIGEGGMIAVLGLEDQQVEFLCQWAVKNSGQGPLSAANFNSPGQVVISGSQKTLNWLKQNFNAEIIPGQPKRAKLIPLTVSAPFHCEMMKPAEDKMRSVLSEINFTDAQFPVCQNFTASLESKAEILRENLIRQVSAPVLWTQSMSTLKASGMTKCIECGQGSVVKGLLKKIDSEAFSVWTTNTLEDIKIIEENLKATGH